ncbi:MAG: hypothetical protein Q7T94_08720 [Rugosibacter sp.]|nr:hypothetical protein [Rugosibacter sp.]
MMLVHITILSLWEIAHYWNDSDPRESKTHNIPLKVRDTLLVLSMHFGKKLSVRTEQNKAYLLEIFNQAPRFTARHYRQTFKKSIDSKVFGKRFFSNMFVTRSQLGRWCVKQKEPLPRFWFPDNDKYPFNETGDISAEITADGRYKVQLLYDDTVTKSDEPGQGQSVVTSVNENAVRAANAKHASTNKIKEQFIAFYLEQGGNHPGKKSAAERFFDSLDEQKEKLLFLGKEQATRTLLDALRAHLKSAKAQK